MSANYISSYMLSSALRYSVTNNQSALSRATKEATTGRFADVGLQLGTSTGRDVAQRAATRRMKLRVSELRVPKVLKNRC